MLLRLLLLTALTAGLVVLADKDSGDSAGTIGRLFGDVVDPRLAANAVRIINLEKKLGKVKEKLQQAEKVDPERFINNLLVRVDDLEGTHCPKREFQCGGNEQECVSDLLVCDGHKDCHNGHDEDEDVCDTSPVKAGNLFSGVSHWTDCSTRSDHVTRIGITQTKRRKFFKSRIWVRALVESDVVEDGKKRTSEFSAKGYYNFAQRRLALVPADDHDDSHLAVVCDFNYGDSERATCHRILEASLHECAHLDVELQEHHD